MRSRPISITKPKQLLVEGRDEEGVFEALLSHLEIDDIEVRNYQGKNNFRTFLNVFLNTPGYSQVRSIGIVRDADNSAEAAFQSVRDSLNSLNLPMPDSVQTPAVGSIRVAVFIMPGVGQCGALETLCLSALEDDPAMGCVSDFMQCIQQSVVKVPKTLAKAKIHAFLASREDPELRLGEAALRGYLPWDDAAFAKVIGFVKGV